MISKVQMRDTTVLELRSMAKERGLRGYSKLLKADLLDLLNDPGGGINLKKNFLAQYINNVKN